MKTNHKHYSAGAVIWIIIKYFSLVFFSFVALLPIVSCVITAFKTDAEYQSTNVMTLPESWLNFQNFIDAFNRANMGRAYLNSAIILVFVLLGSVLVGTQLAYVLNRFKFPGNGLIRSLFRRILCPDNSLSEKHSRALPHPTDFRLLTVYMRWRRTR